MKLIIDFGNTLKKIAIFNKDEIVELQVYEQFSTKQLSEIINSYKNIESAIISSVINYPLSLKKFLNNNFNFIELTENTPVPVINKYKTPETLGKDRLAAVVAANHMYPDENLLVIDAGTCITYDFINSKKEYFGGGISPGISMRFQSLHNFTDKLPLLKMKYYDTLIGCTTEDSIYSGVIIGVIAEIEGIIEKYKKKYSSLKIIFSGGDIKYFDKRLKNNIFALPNIVLLGLNVILDFNNN